MLHQKAISPAALELLKKIADLKELESFGLGGGTSLALRIGHRLSIDLDFFTNVEFDTTFLFQLITKKFPSAELLFEKNQTMMFSIYEIKVDFVLYPFPWLQPFDKIENIQLISIRDIIPMKLQAVSNRNAKKDYWDLAALLREYSLEEMIKMFTEKFPQIDRGFIIHSLTDFEKADHEPDPETFTNTKWEDIKLELVTAVKQYTQDQL